MFKFLFLLIFVPFLLICLLCSVAITKFLRRVQDVKRQFMGDAQGQRQPRGESQRRAYRPTGQGQVYDSRSATERNRKIIAKEEGDYVDYEEVN